jgi:hypothetical protein
MKCLNLFGLVLIVATLCAAGCSNSEKSGATADSGRSEPAGAMTTEHTHGNGPNGGVVFDLGSHHAEFTVDHGKQQCTILILGDDEKTPSPIAASEFILNIEETKTADGTVVAPMTVTMSPTEAVDGKSSTFVGTDAGIGNVADFAGTVSGEIDGKPAMGEFKE